MNVVIIGSGNTATVLGHKIYAAGHTILQVVGRTAAPTAVLASALEATYTTDWSAIDGRADLYLLAISDSALEAVAGEWRMPGKLVVHTAGAVPAAILSPVSDRCGVLYPLQSLRKNVRPFPAIPFLVDALREADKEILLSFARTLSEQVQEADDDTRLKLHVSAVVVNNFTNYLYAVTADYCGKEGIDFSLLFPLIRETAERLALVQPREVQTGPAVRGDKNTISRHLELIDNYVDLKELYRLLTVKIEESTLFRR